MTVTCRVTCVRCIHGWLAVVSRVSASCAVCSCRKPDQKRFQRSAVRLWARKCSNGPMWCRRLSRCRGRQRGPGSCLPVAPNNEPRSPAATGDTPTCMGCCGKSGELRAHKVRAAPASEQDSRHNRRCAGDNSTPDDTDGNTHKQAVSLRQTVPALTSDRARGRGERGV